MKKIQGLSTDDDDDDTRSNKKRTFQLTGALV
jgi:hypothetical protein